MIELFSRNTNAYYLAQYYVSKNLMYSVNIYNIPDIHSCSYSFAISLTVNNVDIIPAFREHAAQW